MNTLENVPLLVFSRIMSFLSPNEVFQTRQISTTMKSKVEENSQELQKRLKLHSVDFGNFEEFQEFIASVSFAKFTSFSFDFNPVSKLETKEMKGFLDRFGPIIESLTIPKIGPIMSNSEIDFFNKMVNLKELKVQKITYYANGYDMMLPKATAIEQLRQGRMPIATPTFPHAFKKIDKFGFQESVDGPSSLILLYGLPNLNCLSMGRLKNIKGDSEFTVVTRYLNLRAKMEPWKSSLKTLKLPDRHSLHASSQRNIEDFVKATLRYSVRLQNAHGTLISEVLKCEKLESEEKVAFCNLIWNIRGLKPDQTNLTFDGMESIHLMLNDHEFHGISELDVIEKNHPRSRLKNLKDIHLKINVYDYEQRKAKDRINNYFKFLFGYEENCVEEIKIDSNVGGGCTNSETQRRQRNGEEIITLINPMLLVVNNKKALESITLNIRNYHSADYAKLLHELAENCPGIRLLDLTFNNSARKEVFEGPDIYNPTLLRMKNLRHLSLSTVFNPLNKEWYAVNSNFEILRHLFPLLSLTCLRISEHGDRIGMFKGKPDRVRAFLNGKIGKTLRWLHWDYYDNHECDDYILLQNQIKINKAAVTSISTTTTKKCQKCENLGNTTRESENWLQVPRMN